MRKLSEFKSVAVHNGNFHADDLFSVALIQIKNPNIEIIRTRDKEILKEADIRVDVGGKYDPETHDFDHHQKEVTTPRKNGIPYASFGLLWKNYWDEFFDDESDAQKFDKQLVQPIDADDNGFEIINDSVIFPYTISKAVITFNPTWDDEKSDFDSAFKRALVFAREIILNEIKNIKSMKKAKEMIEKEISKSEGMEYLILDKYVSWRRFISGDKTNLKFIIYYDKINECWVASAIPEKINSYNSVKYFPKSWGGLDSEELQKVTGVPDAIFCHKNRFICSAKSKEGILKMVNLALNNH